MDGGEIETEETRGTGGMIVETGTGTGTETEIGINIEMILGRGKRRRVSLVVENKEGKTEIALSKSTRKERIQEIEKSLKRERMRETGEIPGIERKITIGIIGRRAIEAKAGIIITEVEIEMRRARRSIDTEYYDTK